MDRKYCLIVFIVSKSFMHRCIERCKINMKMIYLRSVKKQNLNSAKKKGGEPKGIQYTRTMYLCYPTYIYNFIKIYKVKRFQKSKNLTLRYWSTHLEV